MIQENQKLKEELADKRIRLRQAGNIYGLMGTLLQDTPAPSGSTAITKAIGMMEALARLYQISLSRGREIITLQQEFEHAESYLKIQEKRYHGNFEYALYMDEGIGKFSVVKVVLQPLIENAIYHGVRKMSEGGSIIVRGRRCGEDRILLSVMDNGNMLGREGCEKMNKALTGNEEGVLGVGVSNVMARLRLYYGEDCSMRYVMRDSFTVAEIEIPIREMNGDV